MKGGWPGRATNGATVADIALVRHNSVRMEQQRGRKTYKYKLKVTPEQERLLDRTLMLCRHVYNAARGEAARGERREAWQKCGVSVLSLIHI